MPSLSYTSREEIEQHSFPAAVLLLVPVAAIIVQALLSRLFSWFSIVDLPLIVVIFFAVSRRSPASGTVTGAAIGLAQDALTGRPIGINGIAKSVVGYIAASIGVRIDVDNPLTRILMNFGFSLLNSVILFLINRRLLGQAEAHIGWVHELIRAVANTVIAIPIFFVLDLTRRPE